MRWDRQVPVTTTMLGILIAAVVLGYIIIALAD